MSRINIPAALRRIVTERSNGQCEYCLLHQDDAPFSHHVDHVTPLRHGGQTVESNLALACLECNRYKGSDLTAIDPADGAIVPLFNPRTQVWSEHFTFDGIRIVGQTPAGRATVNLLRLNDPARLLQRQALLEAKRYPPR
jgi:hypothetical protein